ncbi:MAG: cell envelope integrity protein CreD [Acidobacteriota bacterium]|nr:cell envelope integrity protein CreD [Acidobacteriota bacterium]
MSGGQVTGLQRLTSSYGFKIVLLAVLILFLMIPVLMVRNLIDERKAYSREAENGIMAAWGGPFILEGPVIRVPVVHREEIHTKTEKDGDKVEFHERSISLWIMPKKVDVKASFQTEVKRRGIFSVPLFAGDVAITGSVDPGDALASLQPYQTPDLSKAEVVISLTSQKGIRKLLRARIGGADLFFKPGRQGFADGLNSNDGIYAVFPLAPDGDTPFDIGLTIQGGEYMRVLPVAESTTVSLDADWPSPSFQGGFLPVKREVSDKGFTASWEISYLSRAIPLFWTSDATPSWNDALFGVDLYKVLDVYGLCTRAAKYAMLFLFIPFLTLFFLEVFARKSIHPVQYLLAGFSNVVFYLLLLSLAEHIAFGAAYLASAATIMAMLVLYSRSLLDSWRRSASLGLVLALLYLILYLTLNAEDWALLIGSVATVTLTAVVMYITRRLDWNAGAKPPADGAGAAVVRG